MRKGFALYTNELYKFIRRKGLWILCINLLILFNVVGGMRYLNGSTYSSYMSHLQDSPEWEDRNAALEHDIRAFGDAGSPSQKQQDDQGQWLLQQFHAKRIPVLDGNYNFLYTLANQALSLKKEGNQPVLMREDLQPWVEHLKGSVGADFDQFYATLQQSPLKHHTQGEQFLRLLHAVQQVIQEDPCPEEDRPEQIRSGSWSSKVDDRIGKIMERIQVEEALEKGYTTTNIKLNTLSVSNPLGIDKALMLPQGIQVDGKIRTILEGEQAFLQSDADQLEQEKRTEFFFRTFYIMQMLGSMIFGIFWIARAGSNLSSELSTGTIKALIITPVKRSKIVWAKALSLLTVLVAGAVILFFLCYGLTGLYEGGFPHYDVQYFQRGSLHVLPVWMICAVEICSSLFTPFCIGLFAWMLSVCTRNTIVAVALGLSGFLLKNLGVVISHVLNLSVFASLNPYVHLDWFRRAIPMAKNFLLDDLNPCYATLCLKPDVWFSLLYVLLLICSFFWIAYDSFTRRDIQ